MKIKFSTSFSLRSSGCKTVSSGGKDKEFYPIRMRVTFRGQRVDFASGYFIEAEKWDADAQKVTRNASDDKGHTASDINRDLLRMATAVEDCFKRYELEECFPTLSQFKDDFNILIMGTTKGVRSGVNTFLDSFNEFTSENGEKKNWTAATYEKFDAMWNSLMAFRPNATFYDFNERGLIDYVAFLRDNQGLKNSTIEKKLGFLKWFLKWAEEKGYHRVHDYASFKPKFKTTQNRVVFLNREEISRLRAFVAPVGKEHLERVRDVFIFCCFTGLRHSDVKNLKRQNVKNDHIEVTTIKTADTLSIELNDVAKSVLDKYKDWHFENDAVLPVLSNQKMNIELKELCQMAGIDSPVSKVYFRGNERIEETLPKYECIGTHTGRRTFICNALSLGVPVNIVMSWTGHSDYQQIKPYIDVVDEIKAAEMKKLNTL